MEHDRQNHWQQVYGEKAEDAVSWYQLEPSLSLHLIGKAALAPDDPVIDIGGGASVLVDHLLDAGHKDVTVLDIAHTGMAKARARLGDRAGEVNWIVSDITKFEPSRSYALWHDRAAFHFLGEVSDRVRYREVLDLALRPAGHAIIATFEMGGPEICSGLPVTRYSAESLEAELGSNYTLLEDHMELHQTPWNSEQRFLYTLFRKRA